jgi:hypothetical protein
MMNELVTVANLVEYLSRTGAPQLGRNEGTVLQSRTRNRRELNPVGKTHPTMRSDDDVAADFEVFYEDLQHAGRDPVLDFEQGKRPVALFLEAAIHDFEQRFGGIVGMSDCHPHVTHDTEEMSAADSHAGEELSEILADDIFQQRKAEATFVGRERDEPGEQVGHFNARKLRSAAMVHDDREITAPV